MDKQSALLEQPSDPLTHWLPNNAFAWHVYPDSYADSHSPSCAHWIHSDADVSQIHPKTEQSAWEEQGTVVVVFVQTSPIMESSHVNPSPYIGLDVQSSSSTQNTQVLVFVLQTG